MDLLQFVEDRLSEQMEERCRNGFRVYGESVPRNNSSCRVTNMKRHKEKIQGIDPNEVGLLRTTPFVKTCWEQNVDFAHALKAKIAVIQLPPSFQYDTSGFERLKTFFEFVEPDITCAIEFRHVSWIPR